MLLLFAGFFINGLRVGLLLAAVGLGAAAELLVAVSLDARLGAELDPRLGAKLGAAAELDATGPLLKFVRVPTDIGES